MMTTLINDRLITFEYTNWKGEYSTRTAKVIKVWYGETTYHDEPGWLFTGYDFDRKENRDYSMMAMSNVRHYNPDEDEIAAFDALGVE